MSTHSIIETADFGRADRYGRISALASRVRQLLSALMEAKAAADHYETLVARGVSPREASETVFRVHFGRQ